MKTRTAGIILALVPLFFCFNDNNPVAPDEGTTSDTTAPDTSGSRMPFLIPLAPGAAWRYGIYYNYRKIDRNGVVLESMIHHATLTVQVTGSDPEERSYSLACRFVVDSSFSSAHLEPSSADTTLYWDLVTMNDTVFYDLGQGAAYCMPWESVDSTFFRVDLRFLDYPWDSLFHFSMGECILGIDQTVGYKYYGLYQLISYGGMGGKAVPSQGGLVEYDAFYAPGLISEHEKAELSYRLLEYIPGSFGD